MVVVLAMSASNALAQARYEMVDGIRYILDSDAKTATVVASNGEKYSGDIVVPEKVKASDGIEYPVTAFGDYAFNECTNLTNITIPSSVTTLGVYCFGYCSSLKNITIPNSVTSINSKCFSFCDNIKSIILPESLVYLADACFGYCTKLEKIVLPNTIKELKDDLFVGCENLVEVSLPSSILQIDSGCFSECSSLISITIPSSITSLGSGCFRSCSKLTSITIPSSVASLGSYCFERCSNLTSATILSSATSLKDFCFAYCSNLTSITIPSSVTSLGDNCFYNCSSLTSITIPSSVTSLGSSCFYGCTKLEQANFKGKLPSNTLNCGLLNTCILNVPKSYLQDYKDALGSKYPYIYASKEDGDDDKPTEQPCATPTITYAAGKLHFTSATPNAEYHSTITDTDMMSDKYVEDGVLDLSATYHITVYATADGYKPSEKATATLYWINANLENGTSTNINQAKTRGIVATSDGGIVTLSVSTMARKFASMP